MEKVIIKTLPNPDYPQLKMKYVGANEYLTAKIGPDGKLITGLDENALEINMIEDKKKRDAKKKEVEKLRTDLERLLNVELDTNSSFWDDFFIILNDELPLDPQNPRDRLTEIFLVANLYVAPSKEAIETDEKYHHCVFYLYREEEETTKKAKLQQTYDKAVSMLYRLNEDNPHKLKVLVSYIFGFGQEDVTLETAYVKLKEFITVPEIKEESQRTRAQSKNVERFLDAAEKSNEALTVKVLLDKAIKKRIITTKGGVHRRGDFPIGNTYDEALEYLVSPENSAELVSLKKEVEKS